MVIGEYFDSSTNDDKFKTLLKRIHDKLLKTHGFKKENQNFRLIKEIGLMNYGYIINFQKSAYNDNTELRFTVNLGKKISYGKINPKFKEYECSIQDRNRLATMTPQYGFDKWWPITAKTDMIQLETEICNLLEKIAFPWFGIQP